MKIQEINGLPPQHKQRLLFQPDPTLPLPDTMFGIEVELECVPVGAIVDMKNNSIYWTPKKDGSLRNQSMNFIGQEFVFKEPMFGLDIQAAFDELERKLHTENKHKTKISHSIRTSVHVHVDMRDKDLEELKKILYVYMIFEKMLFNYEGTGREDSQFCIPMYKFSTRYMNELREAGGHRNRAREFLMMFDKYGAINLEAILRFGSIEFRHMHGISKADELREWLVILSSIIKYALTVENVLDLPGNISIVGVNEFIKAVFGDELFDKLNYDRAEMDIYEGIRLAQEYIYCDEIFNNSDKNLLLDEDDYMNKYKYAFIHKHPEFFGQVREPEFFVEVNDIDEE